MGSLIRTLPRLSARIVAVARYNSTVLESFPGHHSVHLHTARAGFITFTTQLRNPSKHIANTNNLYDSIPRKHLSLYSNKPKGTVKGQVPEDYKEASKSKPTLEDIFLTTWRKRNPDPNETTWFKIRRHLMPFLSFLGLSVGWAIVESNTDNWTYRMEVLDEDIVQLWDSDPAIVLTYITQLGEDAARNDTLKVRLASNPKWFDRIVELCKTPDDDDATTQNAAALLVNRITRSPEACHRLIQRGQDEVIAGIVKTWDTSLFIRKELCMALSQFAAIPTLHDQLLEHGVFSALHLVYSNPDTRRHVFRIALDRLALSPRASSIGRDASTVAQWRVQAQSRTSGLAPVYDTLVESGVILYFHTAVGGAVWGLIDGLRQGLGRQAMIQSVVRTSLVTSMIPITVVGLGVSTWQYLRKGIDDPVAMLGFNVATGMTLYPWYYLLPIIERWAPLWLGGHIVGFMSFFFWLVYTNSDLMQHDNALHKKDKELRRLLAERAVKQGGIIQAEAKEAMEKGQA